MTDQQRTDSIGSYGCHCISTPSLDMLADQGVLFENCYVNNPICTPSRASIFTGKEVPGHGVYKLHDNLPQDEVLFPKLLQKQGYDTALFGKLHTSGRITEAQKRHPHDGFDVYEWCMDPGLHLDSPLNAYAAWLKENHPSFFLRLLSETRNLHNFPQEVCFTRWAVDRTVSFIDSRDDQKPFFCCLSLFDPHDPYYDHPIEAQELVYKDKVPFPDDAMQKSGSIPKGLLREIEKSDFTNSSRQEIQNDRLGYYASVAFLDKELGRVLNILDKKGLNKNTIVIFISDHGDMLGDKRLFQKGAYFYDACTKVPLIIRYPKVLQKGQKIKSLVQPHDVAATLLCASGYCKSELDHLMPASIDLISAIHKKQNMGLSDIQTRSQAVCVYRNTGYGPGGRYFDPPLNASMITNGRYKLNLYHSSLDILIKPEGELYDLECDPKETCNIWDNVSYADTKLTLINQLINWMVQNDVSYCGTRGGESVTQMADYKHL